MKVSRGEARGRMGRRLCASHVRIVQMFSRSISSLPASLAPRQPPSAVGLGQCCSWHPGRRKAQLSTAHAQQHHPGRPLSLLFNHRGSMSSRVAETVAAAQETSSFAADRNPPPSRTSREKGFLKKNVWQSNSFHVYWGLYFYISLFSKFNIPQHG